MYKVGELNIDGPVEKRKKSDRIKAPDVEDLCPLGLPQFEDPQS